MSKKKDDTRGKKAPEPAPNVGISAEVPLAMRDNLFGLADLTHQSASHHVRLALLRYLTSDEVLKQREEAERFVVLSGKADVVTSASVPIEAKAG